MISEKKLIEWLSRDQTRQTPLVIRGIGDDCAVLSLSSKKNSMVVSTDSLVEGVDFTFKVFSAADVAIKALETSLSDIAAMGAIPRFVLLSLGIPKNKILNESWLKTFFTTFKSRAKNHAVELVGGDLSSSPKDFWISVTVMGEAKKCVMRTGAKAGDTIWTTGPLGYAALGLRQLKKNTKARGPFVQAQKNPVARIKEGQILARTKGVTSLMDISDGLLSDLEKICEANSVGAVLQCDEILFLEKFASESQKAGADFLTLALTGGEDYELLFTLDSRASLATIKKLKTQIPGICLWGRLCGQNEGLIIEGVSPGYLKKLLKNKGFDHFCKR